MREPETGYERVLGQLGKVKPDSKCLENRPVDTWRDVGPRMRRRILRQWQDEAQPLWNAARSARGVGRYRKPEEADEAEAAYEALRASDIGESDRVPMLVPVMPDSLEDALPSEDDLLVEPCDSSDEWTFALPNKSRQKGSYLSLSDLRDQQADGQSSSGQDHPHKGSGKNSSGEVLHQAKTKTSHRDHITDSGNVSVGWHSLVAKQLSPKQVSQNPTAQKALE